MKKLQEGNEPIVITSFILGGIMYGNFNPQVTRDRIDQQIAQLQQMKEQIVQPMQPTSLTQNFQLAPANQGVMKYANSIEDVRKDVVYTDTPYFSNDLSIMWLKNNKSNIKCYELKEIVEKDQKDLQIEYLMLEIEKLKKGMNNNEQFNSNDNWQNVSTSTSNDNETTRKQTKDDKPSDVQRISKSKTK